VLTSMSMRVCGALSGFPDACARLSGLGSSRSTSTTDGRLLMNAGKLGMPVTATNFIHCHIDHFTPARSITIVSSGMSGLPVKNVGSAEYVSGWKCQHAPLLSSGTQTSHSNFVAKLSANLTVLQGQPKPISEEHDGAFRFQVFIGGCSEVGALM
jgi:hypothetical protein